MIKQGTFILSPVLAADSFFITDLALCQVRLMDNADYPWLILIPRLPALVEITDLKNREYQLFTKEVRLIAKILQQEFTPDKLNIAAIGNVVSQLHIHIVVRYKNDKVFPGSVWGNDFTPYHPLQLKERVRMLTEKIK